MPEKYDFRARTDNTYLRRKVFNENIQILPHNDASIIFNQRKQNSEPSAAIDNLIRTVLPLPKNAASLVMKKIIGRNRMNSSSLSDDEKSVLSKVVWNAEQRTGKLYGGTEYEDYKNTTTDANYQQIIDAKNGKINPLSGMYLGSIDPAYRMATTTGRGSYSINPDNNEEIIYSDEYNFTNNFTQDKNGNLKKDYMAEKTGNFLVDKYRNIRKNLAIKDQKIEPENFRTQMNLKSSDTTRLNKFN